MNDMNFYPNGCYNETKSDYNLNKNYKNNNFIYKKKHNFKNFNKKKENKKLQNNGFFNNNKNINIDNFNNPYDKNKVEIKIKNENIEFSYLINKNNIDEIKQILNMIEDTFVNDNINKKLVKLYFLKKINKNEKTNDLYNEEIKKFIDEIPE